MEQLNIINVENPLCGSKMLKLTSNRDLVYVYFDFALFNYKMVALSSARCVRPDTAVWLWLLFVQLYNYIYVSRLR